MTVTIHGLFPTEDIALSVVRELESAGFTHDHIGLVANQVPRPDDINHRKVRDALVDVAPDDALPGVGTATGVGTASGAAIGVMAGLGTIVIPGIGAVVAAGLLASALVGAAAGAATGGLIGVLSEVGVGGEDAEFYNDAVARGMAVVTVGAEHDRAGVADAIMEAHERIRPPGRPSSTGTPADFVQAT